MLKERMCKQCRHVKFMGNMTKWTVQKQTHRTTQKHVEHQDATAIQKKLLFVFYVILKILLLKSCNKTI